MEKARASSEKAGERSRDDARDTRTSDDARVVPTTNNSARLAWLDASESLAGASSMLPHLDQLQAAFGAHELGHVRAVVGNEASETAARLGARAYTVGDRIGFRDPPDLALAAHEAAHVVQQRDGVQLSAHVGRSGDAYERHADAVAATVVAGHSAEPLLGDAPLGLEHSALQLDDDSDPDFYPFSSIYELPSREEYEARGELRPRGAPDFSGTDVLISLDGSGQRMPSHDTQADEMDLGAFAHPDPIPETFGAATDVMTTSQMLLRLSSMEAVGAQISQLAGTDEELKAFTIGMQWVMATTGGRLTSDASSMFTLVGPDYVDPVPTEPAALSREIVRSEMALDRVYQGLIDLDVDLAEEEILAAALRQPDPDPEQDKKRKGPIYDMPAIRGEFMLVRWLYFKTANVVLQPRIVADFNEVDARHGVLEQSLGDRKLAYYASIQSDIGQGEKFASEIRGWAGQIETDVAWLREQAPKVRAAREANKRDLELERTFALKAELVMTSLECLGEYEAAFNAYEALRGNSALWGYESAKRIRWRLEQMRAAALDSDVDYLRLLLRDHRADKDVTEFYQSIPDILFYSALIISLVVMVIASLAVAGVGVVFAAITGVTASNMVILSSAFWIRTGLQAVTFTLVSRALMSGFPGLEPTSPLWFDLVCNLALFGVMNVASTAMRASLAAMTAAERFVVSHVTSFAILQAYGFIRGSIEHGRWLTQDEVRSMTFQNLVLMVGTGIAMKGFEPIIARAEGAVTLRRFERIYGSEFKSIEARRTELGNQIREHIKSKPNATEEDVAGYRERGKELDAELKFLAERIQNDSTLDTAALRTEVARMFRQISRMSMTELLRSSGLDTTIDLMPTGRDGAWAFPRGRVEDLKTFLTSNGYEFVETRTSNGAVLEVSIPGKGRVQFVESPTFERISAPFSEAELAKARTEIAEDAAGERMVGGTRGRAAYDIAPEPIQTPKKVARATTRMAPGLAREGLTLEGVSGKGETVTAKLRVDVPEGTPIDLGVRIEIVPDVQARVDVTADPFSAHGKEAGYARLYFEGDATTGRTLVIELDARLATEVDVQIHLRHELREGAGIARDLAKNPNLDVHAETGGGVFQPGTDTTVTHHARAAAKELRDLVELLDPANQGYQAARQRAALGKGGARTRRARDAGEIAQRRLDAALEAMGFSEPSTRAAKTKILLELLGETPESPIGRFLAEYSARTEAAVVRRAALDRISADRGAVDLALGPELAMHLAKRVPAEAIDPLAQALLGARAAQARELVRQHAGGRMTDAELVSSLQVEVLKSERIKAELAESGETSSRKRTYKAKDDDGHRIQENGLSKEQDAYFRDLINKAADPMQARFQRYLQKIANAEPPVKAMDYTQWLATNPQLRQAVSRGLVVEAEALRAAGATDNNAAGARQEHSYFDKATNQVVGTRADGFVGPDVVESKYIDPKTADQVLYDSPQLRAQRDLAGKGKHRVLLSSEDGSRLNLERPEPRPSSVVAEKSFVEFYDPAKQRITHYWSRRTGKWVEYQ